MTRRGNVRNEQRNQREMQVFVASKKLISYTLKLTNNTNRFKKKWRFTLTNRIQGASLDIFDNLVMANETYVFNVESKNIRIAHQKKALAEIKKLAYLIELSHSMDIIRTKSMDYWSKLLSDVRRLTASWFNQTLKLRV